MDRFVEKGGKRLRYGYTTGSCAAAAAKAATGMLLSGKKLDTVSLQTPKGWSLDLKVEFAAWEDNKVSCQIQKDGGDDPDSTHGMYIGATVEKSEEPGVSIRGGKGIGLVTKPGLDQPVGTHAINSVPRRMIEEGVMEAVAFEGYKGGLLVTIFAPEGEERAKKTYNPRIGILGGISILGTTGIVEPMSEKALLDSLEVELNVIRCNGNGQVVVFPGNYGKTFAQENLDLDLENSIKIGNYFGEVLERIQKLDFKEAIFVGHIGKMVKLAGGIMNTHSHHSDARMEILGAYAGLFGAPKEVIEKILDSATCDDALAHLDGVGLKQQVMDHLVERIEVHLRYKLGTDMDIKLILFSNDQGILGFNRGARVLMKQPYPVAIVGMGPGHSDYLLPKAWEAIGKAQVLIGGRRHLDGVGLRIPLNRKELIYVEDGLPVALEYVLEHHKDRTIACLVSGDPGFYSLTGYLKKNAPQVTFEVIAGISSVTYLFSRLQELWHPATIMSLHGKKEVPVELIKGAPLCVLLTDQEYTPSRIAGILLEKGLSRTMIVAENLSYPEERISTWTLEEAAVQRFENLNLVVLKDDEVLSGNS